MALHMDGDFDGLLELGDQFVGHIGLQQSRHVFDTEGIGAHALYLPRHIQPTVDVMHGAESIGHRPLGMFLLLAHSLDRPLKIARIVHGIEDPKYIDTVDCGSLYEFVNHIIGIMTIAQDILTSEQHLLGGIGHGFLEFSDALPRVFSQESNTGIEGRSTPGFQRPEANLIKFLSDWEHVIDAHSGG